MHSCLAAEFYRKGKAMNFYKITNKTETHHFLTYHDGLNIDPVPFSPTCNCASSGIHFAREDILALLLCDGWTGKYIREVGIPEDAKVHEISGLQKYWKADKVILGPRRELTVEVFHELLEEGANIHAGGDLALRWAAGNGDCKAAKMFLENGADIHIGCESTLVSAVENGDINMAELSLEYGADIHIDHEYPLSRAVEDGNINMVRLLLKHGADPCADDDHLLSWAAENSDSGMVKFLSEYAAGISAK